MVWHCDTAKTLEPFLSLRRSPLLAPATESVSSVRWRLLSSAGDNSYGSKLVPQNVVVYYWQMTSNDQLISLDLVFKHLTQTLFRSVTSVKTLHLIHGCSMKSHHRCLNPDFPNASRFRFDPFACQCFSSLKRYDWDETSGTWEKMSKLELSWGDFSSLWFTVDGWCCGHRSPSGHLERRHVLAWESSFFGIFGHGESYSVCICHGICGLFGEKGGKNRLAVRCCGAVGMSFAQRDDGPKWSKCNAWMKWLPCPKRCPKGWGCNIGKDTLLHKSAQTPPKLLSSAVHCYPFPKNMPKKRSDRNNKLFPTGGWGFPAIICNNICQKPISNISGHLKFPHFQ